MRERRSPYALALLLAAAAAAPAQTSVYRSVDDQGNVIFSDTPSPQSERIVVPPVQTFADRPPARAPDAGAETPARPAGGARYARFVIASPADDAAVRSNAGEVSVALRLEPALRGRDRIAVFIDGRPAAPPGRSTALTLGNVDRGSHRLHAVVVDPTGQEVARTAPVRFHLLRASAR